MVCVCVYVCVICIKGILVNFDHKDKDFTGPSNNFKDFPGANSLSRTFQFPGPKMLFKKSRNSQ